METCGEVGTVPVHRADSIHELPYNQRLIVHYDDAQYAARFWAFEDEGPMWVVFDGETEPCKLDGDEGVTLINDFDTQGGRDTDKAAVGEVRYNDNGQGQGKVEGNAAPADVSKFKDKAHGRRKSSIREVRGMPSAGDGFAVNNFKRQLLDGLRRQGASEQEIAEVQESLRSYADETFDEKDQQLANESIATFYEAARALQRRLGKVSSVVWCMLGSLAFLAGLLTNMTFGAMVTNWLPPFKTKALFLHHFPVSVYYMWGAEEGKPAWPNLFFTDFFGKLCCTGFHVALMGKHLGFERIFNCDLHPFVASARDGGHIPGNPLHEAVAKSMVSLFLALGVRCIRIASATVYKAVYQILESKAKKAYNIPVEADGMTIHVHVTTGIPNGKGNSIAVLCFGSDHMSMARFRGAARILCRVESLFRLAIGQPIASKNLENWKIEMPGTELTAAEQKEAFSLFLEDRKADGTWEEWSNFIAGNTTKKHKTPNRPRSEFSLAEQIDMWYGHKGGEFVFVFLCLSFFFSTSCGAECCRLSRRTPLASVPPLLNAVPDLLPQYLSQN